MMHQMLYPTKNVTSFATAPGSVSWVIMPFWYCSDHGWDQYGAEAFADLGNDLGESIEDGGSVVVP